MVDMADLRPDEKLCPYCAEVIKAAAIKCRYCHSEIAASPAPATPGPGTPAARTPGTPAAGTPSVASEAPHAEPSRQPLLASARLLAVLVVLCVVLTGVTAWAWYRSEHPAEGKAPDGAITSAEARDAGMQAAAQLTAKVLSYDWKTLPQDTRAAEAVLAPSFRSEYAKTMAGVRDQTLKNQVKLVATPAATSIVSATEDTVVALVFVNQVTTAKGAQNSRVDTSRVLVTLTRRGGEWRISKLKPF